MPAGQNSIASRQNFPSPQFHETLTPVKRNFAIRQLLAILMIAGLALAPVSRPVMAATSSQGPMQAMADEMTPSQMTSPEMSSSEMSADTMDEMPCCPSKAPVPVDCDKCVFMAACGSVCFAGIPASISHPFPVVSDTIALQRNDARPDGLGHPPPEHPPRSLV
jgi:hypothetical protein